MTHRRRVAALLSAAALAAGLAVAPALTAAADTSGCEVTATLPAALRIVSTSMAVSTEVRDPSSCMDWASYDIERADGAQTASVVADHAGTQRWTLYTNLYGDSGGPGRYTARFDAGYDTNSDDILGADSNTMVARFASRISAVDAERTRGRIYLAARASRYTYTGGSYGTPGWGAWRSAAVKFQYRSGGAWHTVRTAKTSRWGWAHTTVTAGRRQWRAVVADTATTWGVASRSVTR